MLIKELQRLQKEAAEEANKKIAEEKRKAVAEARINDVQKIVENVQGTCFYTNDDKDAVFVNKFKFIDPNDVNDQGTDVTIFGVFPDIENDKMKYMNDFRQDVRDLLKDAMMKSYTDKVDPLLLVKNEFSGRMQDYNKMILGAQIGMELFIFDKGPGNYVKIFNDKKQTLGGRRINLEDQGYVYVILGDNDFRNALGDNLVNDIFGFLFNDGGNLVEKMIEQVSVAQNGGKFCNLLLNEANKKLKGKPNAKETMLFIQLPGGRANNVFTAEDEQLMRRPLPTPNDSAARRARATMRENRVMRQPLPTPPPMPPVATSRPTPPAPLTQDNSTNDLASANDEGFNLEDAMDFGDDVVDDAAEVAGNAANFAANVAEDTGEVIDNAIDEGDDTLDDLFNNAPDEPQL